MLALYVSSPTALNPSSASLAALGLFAMAYTGVGVAHAFQGPPRKRLPRIALMAAVTAFTAAADAWAGCLGLLLALLAALYLAEGRRRVLLPWFCLWSAVAGIAAVLPLPGNRAAAAPNLLLLAPGGVALAGALAVWAVFPRSRYFGNSAPLLASIVLLGATPWVGARTGAWILPFALLFVAGVACDAWEGRFGRLWAAFFWSVAVVQCAVTYQ